MKKKASQSLPTRLPPLLVRPDEDTYKSALLFQLCLSCDFSGRGKQIVTIKKLKVFPDPIRLNGKNIKISVDAELHEDVPTDVRFYLKAWKVKVLPFGLKMHIPAPSPIPGDVYSRLNGDCGRVVDLADFNINIKSSRGKLLKAQSCRFDDITIPIPKIEGFYAGVLKWLLSGRFLIELKIMRQNVEQLSCYTFEGRARQ
ncbi:ML domain-containing protein [Caerostris extrusa]|uniref:ML domain-containing protein n=1 Tax=Caerostris extrusa TaxID=172846 RepID=A0AAV4SZC2_CAEEX|nr:ML domain-containing protein [Caerostris extrusa]